MNREDVEKLLGGYATGTLTPEEREALFAAALDDQELFNALSREQALHDLLQEPAARAQLIATMDNRRLRRPMRFASWFRRPARGPLFAAAATACAALIVLYVARHPAHQAEPLTVAQYHRQLPSGVIPAEPPRAQVEMEQPETPPTVERKRAVRRAPAPLRDKALESAPPERQLQAQAKSEVTADAVPPPPPAAVPAPAPPAAPAAPPPGPSEAVSRSPVFGALGGVAGANLSSGAPRSPEDPRTLYYGFSFRSAEAHEAAGPAISSLKKSESSDAAGKAKTAAAPARARVEVQPAAPGMAGASVRTVAYAPHLGVRYTVLLHSPGGATSEADPAADFHVGDQITLRLEPNDNGYLYVMQRTALGAWSPLAEVRAQRLVPVLVPSSGTLTLEHPGQSEFSVLFSRQPESRAAEAAQPIAGFVSGGILSVTRPAQLASGASEGSVYVVNKAVEGASQQVGFTIRLNCK